LTDPKGANAAEDRAYETAAEQAFSEWSLATGLQFKETSNSSEADIKIGFGDLNTPSTALVGFTTYTDPNGQMQSATISLEDPAQDALLPGANSQLTYAGTQATLNQVMEHEIGHALGLADNGISNSIMDYYLGSDNQTLSNGDIEAAQSLYGVGASATAVEATSQKLVHAMAAFGGNSSHGAVISSLDTSPLAADSIAANVLHAHHT